MDVFTPGQGPIVVNVELSGPVAATWARLILDTGATSTTIKPDVSIAIGYDPDFAAERVSVTTVDGIRVVPRLHLNRFTALGQHRLAFPVVCHPLPTADGIQGLLGLDFFRGTLLTVDFVKGQIEVR